MRRRNLVAWLLFHFFSSLASLVASDESWGFVLPPPPRIIYSLNVHGDNGGGEQKLMGTVQFLEGVEVADTAGAFCDEHHLPRAQRDAIIQHVCGSDGGSSKHGGESSSSESFDGLIASNADVLTLLPDPPEASTTTTAVKNDDNNDNDDGGGVAEFEFELPSQALSQHPSGNPHQHFSHGAISDSSDRRSELKCSRRRPKRFLFDFSVRDTKLKEPLFVQVAIAVVGGCGCVLVGVGSLYKIFKGSPRTLLSL